MKDHQIILRVTGDLREQVERAAQADDRTISNFVDRAIKHELDRKDKR